MAGEDEEAGGDCGGGLVGDDVCEKDGEGALAEVENEDEGGALEAAGAQDVAGARSAAAVLTHVDTVEEPDN